MSMKSIELAIKDKETEIYYLEHEIDRLKDVVSILRSEILDLEDIIKETL